jgi:hypothetical protein
LLGFLAETGATTWCFGGHLWCYAWLVWYLNSHIFRLEKCATDSGFIFALPVLGDGSVNTGILHCVQDDDFKKCRTGSGKRLVQFHEQPRIQKLGRVWRIIFTCGVPFSYQSHLTFLTLFNKSPSLLALCCLRKLRFCDLVFAGMMRAFALPTIHT